MNCGYKGIFQRFNAKSDGKASEVCISVISKYTIYFRFIQLSVILEICLDFCDYISMLTFEDTRFTHYVSVV